MEPVKNVIPGIQDTEIAPPPGEEETVLPLPAVITLNHDGWPVIISRFQLQPHEREAIARGEDVYLYVFAPQMVPVIMTTDKPLVGTRGIGGPQTIVLPDNPDYPMLAGPPAVGG